MASAAGAENRKQFKENMGEAAAAFVLVVAAEDGPAASAAKAEKQRMGDVGVVNPYGLKAELPAPGEVVGEIGSINSDGVMGLEKQDEK